MKALPISALVLTGILTLATAPAQAQAPAQAKPDPLVGRWKMVACTPDLESQAAEYAKFVGYSPAREKEIIDEIRDMKKNREDQLLVISEGDLSFQGIEVFGASARLGYKKEGSKLATTFSGVSSNTGGAGAKVEELVPESFTYSLSGDTLTLKSGPIPGYKGKSIIYKFERFTKVEGEMRDWNGAGGTTFQAKVVDFKNGTVVLENADGKTINIPAARLSPADKKYLQELIKSSQ